MSTLTTLPPLAIRFLEVLAPGRPEALDPQPLGENEWALFQTPEGPVALRVFPGQDNLKVRFPTRSREGIRFGMDAEARRAWSIRAQSSFNSKEWIVDLRPDDSYDYLKGVARNLWVS